MHRSAVYQSADAGERLLKTIDEKQIPALLKSLAQKEDLSRERAEAIVHALVDIGEAMEEISTSLIPRLTEANASDVSERL